MQNGEQVTREAYINRDVIPDCEDVYRVKQKVAHRIVRNLEYVSWITTQYLVEVQHVKGETIQRKLAELAVLRKERNHSGSWKIDMIHWSNCPHISD